MAERIVYVGSACTVTLTLPSDKDTVVILPLEAGRHAERDPRLVKADVTFRYLGADGQVKIIMP